jgi:circadian clock protein KaiB
MHMTGKAESSPPEPSYRLRLFIAGNTDRSRRAIENLRRLCAENLAGAKIDLEVVDIYQQPELAAPNQVIAAPTLVKLLPLPVRRIIGDLSETEHVLQGLELFPVSLAAEPHGS